MQFPTISGGPLGKRSIHNFCDILIPKTTQHTIRRRVSLFRGCRFAPATAPDIFFWANHGDPCGVAMPPNMFYYRMFLPVFVGRVLTRRKESAAFFHGIIFMWIYRWRRWFVWNGTVACTMQLPGQDPPYKNKPKTKTTPLRVVVRIANGGWRRRYCGT